MQGFNVRFDSPLISAAMAGAESIVSEAPKVAPAPTNIAKPAPKPSPPPVDLAMQTLDAIKNELRKTTAELSSQHAALQSTAASYAIEIVRVFLGSTSDAVEQRLQQNVIRVLQHPDAVIVKLHVHSSCHESIKRWLNEESDLLIPDLAIEVLEDDSLSPGDCRVDFGQSGRLASLEDQLKLVESKLRDSIRADQIGGRQ